MAKSISFRKGLSSLLFWSIISAAFIGPGTVTTAAKAGSAFGTQLLWALFFSTIATIFLQEAAARITIGSGLSLGEVIQRKFKSNSHLRIRQLLFFAVAFGCAAYQTGNLLGALAGLQLATTLPHWLILLAIGVLAATLLYFGSIAWIAKSLGALVALMGFLFIFLAIKSPEFNFQSLEALFKPSFPDNSTLLITALIGTTIVPYNLFLASGIGKGQSLREMRTGLILAVAIGGIISMSILLVGTSIPAPFSFEALANELNTQLGPLAGNLFAFGLFAAGLSSAITAPLAASITGASLLNWKPKSRPYQLTWIIILGIGILLGMLQLKPVPAIIIAQAINGILLPLVAVFLYLAVNDTQILGSYANSKWLNFFLLTITALAVWIGLHNLVRLIDPQVAQSWTLIFKLSGTALTILWLAFKTPRNA